MCVRFLYPNGQLLVCSDEYFFWHLRYEICEIRERTHTLFQLKPTALLTKVCNVHNQLMGDTLRYFVDGHPVQHNDTPELLNMQNFDTEEARLPWTSVYFCQVHRTQNIPMSGTAHFETNRAEKKSSESPYESGEVEVRHISM